jgi:hypothetical protein
MLLDNRFVYQPFWDFHNNKIAEEDWKHGVERARKAANHALASRQTVTEFAIILDRMYTLPNGVSRERNQEWCFTAALREKSKLPQGIVRAESPIRLKARHV